MLIAIDVGNTNVKFAICTSNRILKIIRIASQQAKTADQYFFYLNNIINQLNTDFKNINNIIISSVVPSITKPMLELSKNYFNINPIILDNNHADIFNIKINLQNKALGSDRLADIIAASNIYPNKDLLIIGMGTATVFNLLNKDKCIYGQVIAPGAHILAKSMRQFTALLPEVSVSKQDKVVHNNIYHAMESGVYWGYITMVNGMIEKIIKEEKKDLHVIATGGNSYLFFDHKTAINNIETDLTIKGILYLHNMLSNNTAQNSI
ncbi:type III pantothenate kinase [Ehrlichia canis]|uniref:type III pantothenate kinase n=1 Tax=Ehrlichia canis TaxID=944 RepID=UPI000C85DD8D|nr:type III pantothenate kinase [Ehrlichia canis]AUO55008.1 type III pantothenate kinase [Ehrlichia canis]UKC53428.1 type III pantothenate kinase [Ehrlichia canis]UKC54364.1 type III pantothenate kinase [Ehrlichia canis]UKC55301.1 type III pantothenate kinase [Ehrlichia canis]